MVYIYLSHKQTLQTIYIVQRLKFHKIWNLLFLFFFIEDKIKKLIFNLANFSTKQFLYFSIAPVPEELSPKTNLTKNWFKFYYTFVVAVKLIVKHLLRDWKEYKKKKCFVIL